MIKKILGVCGLAAAIPVIAGWWGAQQLAHPPRRTLQDFHREFLAGADAHGTVVRPFTTEDGTPCMVCEPGPEGRLGKRGELIRAQLVKKGVELPPAGEIRGTLVLVHGRRGRKEDYLLIAERFCATGFRCILPDLPAHGDHPAHTAGYGTKEALLPQTVLREAAARFGFDPEPAGLMGLSMGGAVCVRSAAATDAPWRTVVLVATFDSLENVVRHQSQKLAGRRAGNLWAGMTGWFFERETGVPPGAASSINHAPHVRRPVLVAHGSADRVIPPALGRRLFEAFAEQPGKKWVEIPGADHDNVLITDFPIYAEMAAWMLRHVRR